MNVSVVIVAYNDYETVKTLIDTIKSYESLHFIVVVDNKSTNDDYEKLVKLKSNKVIVLQANENKGYSSGNNIGIKWILENTNDEIIAIANADVYFEENLVTGIIKDFENKPDYSICTGVQFDSSGNLAGHPFWALYTPASYIRSKISEFRILSKRFQSDDYRYSRAIMNSNHDDFFQVGAVEGSLFFIRSADFVRVGLFDENVFLFNEENILAVKIAKIGKKIGVDATLHYVHYGKHTTCFLKNDALKYTCKSSIYFFDNYLSDNGLLRIVNRAVCSLKKLEGYRRNFIIKEVSNLISMIYGISRWVSWNICKLIRKASHKKNAKVINRNIAKKVHLIYRISDAGYKKTKPSYINNFNCLQNALEVFDPSVVQWEIICDNCCTETMDKIYELTDRHGVARSSIIEVHIGNGAGTFRLAYEHAMTFSDDDIVYFLENDYLHVNTALEGMVRAFNTLPQIDYLTCYDHPDKYDAKYEFSTLLMRQTVYFDGVIHWQKTPSTTMTFASRVKTLKEDRRIFKKWTNTTHPFDFMIFLDLQLKSRILVSPIPSLSTHGETKYLAPCINWESLISDVKN